MKEYLKVSISGVRGTIGGFFTPQTAAMFAQAFGTLVGRGAVIVGRDTRTSGPMIEKAVTAGLQSVGCTPLLAGVVPTPSVLVATRLKGARGGVAITASHNPPEWNAMKFVDRSGLFLDQNHAEEMLDIYHQEDFRFVPEERLPVAQSVSDVVAEHLNVIRAYVDTAAIRRRHFRVAVDCCNGVGAVHTRDFLEGLGCEVHTCHDAPTGAFERGAEPLPENLGAISRLVAASGSDIGFAQDPDGDRLAIVDETGTPIGEDLTVGLGVKQVLEYHARGPVVIHVATSRAVKAAAEALGSEVRLSKIGEINVCQAMIECGAVVGGEGNGGLIVPGIHTCRDSFAAMALVLERMAMTGRSVTALRAEFVPCQIVKRQLHTPAHEAARILRRLRRMYADRRPLAIDGVRVDLDDAWFSVRRSNTESVLRLYTEAPTREAAVAIADRVEKQIHEITLAGGADEGAITP